MLITTNIPVFEMKEFISFEPHEQRYIRQSLHVANRESEALEQMTRNDAEHNLILSQSEVYQDLDSIRQQMPENFELSGIETFMFRVTVLAAFDLNNSKLLHFDAFRFLYERLLGARSRQWLPAIYCSAAALPHIEPSKRKQLLQSLSEASATAPKWSRQEPAFYPEWIKLIDD